MQQSVALIIDINAIVGQKNNNQRIFFEISWVRRRKVRAFSPENSREVSYGKYEIQFADIV